MTSSPMMGPMEQAVAKDSIVKMNDIFRDPHLEGQETNMASPEAVEGAGAKPEAIVV